MLSIIYVLAKLIHSFLIPFPFRLSFGCFVDIAANERLRVLIGSSGELGEDFWAVWPASIEVPVDRYDHVQVIRRLERDFSGAVNCRARDKSSPFPDLLQPRMTLKNPLTNLHRRQVRTEFSFQINQSSVQIINRW